MMIREETDSDSRAVYAVEAAAFEEDEEAELVESLRRNGRVILSLVAEDEGVLVGHILFTRMSIESEAASVPAVSLGPLAVAPSRQNQGIGGKLIVEGLDQLREMGHKVVILLGHPWYYPRFGFRPAREFGLHYQNDRDAFMAIELVPGALDGVVGNAVLPPELHDLPPPDIQGPPERRGGDANASG